MLHGETFAADRTPSVRDAHELLVKVSVAT
jgi:hypothetical protein